MTAEQFGKEIKKRTDKEFQEWFEKKFKHSVEIGGVELPCIILSGGKFALSDGCVMCFDEERTVNSLNESSKKVLLKKLELMKIYEELDADNRFALKNYLDILIKKDRMEKETEPMHCAVCGRAHHEVDFLVTGPDNMCICDECIMNSGLMPKAGIRVVGDSADVEDVFSGDREFRLVTKDEIDFEVPKNYIVVQEIDKRKSSKARKGRENGGKNSGKSKNG